MTCHSVINPLGFTLEHFDAVGRFREKDNGKPIDATGGYQTRDRRDGEVRRRAASWPSSWPTARRCTTAFVEQLFHHLVKQPVRAYGADTAGRVAADRSPQTASTSVNWWWRSPTAAAATKTSRSDTGSRAEQTGVLTPSLRCCATRAADRPCRTRIGDLTCPHRTRREFLRDLGLGAAALPFVLNLPSLGFANQAPAEAAARRHVQPQRRRPDDLLAGRGRAEVHAQGDPRSRWSRSRTRR